MFLLDIGVDVGVLACLYETRNWFKVRCLVDLYELLKHL